MREVMLYTRDGGYVATVLTVPFQLMPEMLNWGQRFFVRETDEKYVEGLCVTVWTKEEMRKMMA